MASMVPRRAGFIAAWWAITGGRATKSNHTRILPANPYFSFPFSLFFPFFSSLLFPPFPFWGLAVISPVTVRAVYTK
ncbi:hypothetical protein BDW60DRAFT_55700 [Aspergillus nidulans var. acristatus]